MIFKNTFWQLTIQSMYPKKQKPLKYQLSKQRSSVITVFVFQFATAQTAAILPVCALFSGTEELDPTVEPQPNYLSSFDVLNSILHLNSLPKNQLESTLWKQVKQLLMFGKKNMSAYSMINEGSVLYFITPEILPNA